MDYEIDYILASEQDDLEKVNLLHKEIFPNVTVDIIEKNYKCLVAIKDSDCIISYLAYKSITDSDGNTTYYIFYLGTKKEYQGNNHAKDLVTLLEAMAERDNANSIILSVRKDNLIAIRLYENLGFTIYDEDPDMYGDNIPGYIYRFNVKNKSYK